MSKGMGVSHNVATWNVSLGNEEAPLFTGEVLAIWKTCFLLRVAYWGARADSLFSGDTKMAGHWFRPQSAKNLVDETEN